MIKSANIETNLQGILAAGSANVNGVNASNAGNPDAAFLEMLKSAEMSGQDIKKIILNLDQKNLEAFEISPELVENLLNAKYEIKNPNALNASAPNTVNKNTNPELAALLKSGPNKAQVVTDTAAVNKEVVGKEIATKEASLPTADVKSNIDPFNSKVRQAEDASLQFTPERKSIFETKTIKPEVAEEVTSKLDMPVANASQNINTAPTTMGTQAVKGEASPVVDKNADVVNMADLLAQRNGMAGKVSKEAAAKQYMGQGAEGKHISMFNTNKKMETETGLKSMNEKQEMLLNELQMPTKMVQMNPENKNQMNLGADTNSAKVLDLSNLNNNAIKTEGQMISAIQDYIIQSRASASKEVSVNFSHQDLGVVGLNVKKMQDDSLQIVLGTQNAAASQFFTQNQHDLMAGLARSGLNVSEFRIETSSSSSSNQNFSENNAKSGGQSSGQNQFADSNEQRRQDSQRRSDLWNMMYQREAA